MQVGALRPNAREAEAMSFVDIARPWQFVGPNGTRYWSGLLQTGVERVVLNANANELVLQPGTAVIADPSGTTAFPRWDLPSTSDPVTGLIAVDQVQSALDVSFIGVALEAIPAGRMGRVGGRGTLCCVKSINPPTASAPGHPVIGSATPGLVDIVGPDPAVDRTGTILGMVIVPPGTGAGQTGSLTQSGIEVNPH